MQYIGTMTKAQTLHKLHIYCMFIAFMLYTGTLFCMWLEYLI